MSHQTDPESVWDVSRVRQDFPLLRTRRVAYLDSAASTLLPACVADEVAEALAFSLPSVHRASHAISDESTRAYEGARQVVAGLLGVAADEVIFTRGTTESLNLLASECHLRGLNPDDEVLVSEVEHHSNLLPWRRAVARCGARLCVVPASEMLEDPVAAFSRRLHGRTRWVAVAHVSNVLGLVLPVRDLCEAVRRRTRDCAIVIDGAQAVAHMPLDIRSIGCDFYTFSGHKAYGTPGVGVLWGRRERLATLEPYHLGGGMVLSVSDDGWTLRDAPQRFEAGTPNVAGARGLARALTYLANLDRPALAVHHHALLQRARERLSRIPSIHVLPVPGDAVGCLSFVSRSVHPHDLATVADASGVAIRAGHLCAQPLLRSLGYDAVARMSLGVYSTCDDVDALVAAIERAVELLG